VAETNEEKVKKAFAALSKHKQYLVLYRVLLQRYARHITIEFDRRSAYDFAMLLMLSSESMFLRSKNYQTLYLYQVIAVSLLSTSHTLYH